MVFFPKTFGEIGKVVEATIKSNIADALGRNQEQFGSFLQLFVFDVVGGCVVV